MTKIRDVADLLTPCLLLDKRKMLGNIERLKARLVGRGPTLRPHLKTAKCVEVARLMMPALDGPAAVSTLREAEQFAESGIHDIVYTVGIAPAKLDRVIALRQAGVDLIVILDSAVQAQAINRKVRETGVEIPVLIEVDSDGHRAGVLPNDPELLAIAKILQEAGPCLRGVMTHAGSSYFSRSIDAIADLAERERSGVVRAAEALRGEGLECRIVSVGSTPTAHFARDLSDVTEVRAGVYVFFDLVMAGIGVCTLDDIAISVLATVIGHQHRKGWLIIDAGWTALSRDHGTATQTIDQGFGVVCNVDGQPYENLVIKQLSQEHAIVAARDCEKTSIPLLPVGTRVRVLPNHACATAAQHAGYWVLGSSLQVTDWWDRLSGW